MRHRLHHQSTWEPESLNLYSKGKFCSELCENESWSLERTKTMEFNEANPSLVRYRRSGRSGGELGTSPLGVMTVLVNGRGELNTFS